MNSIFEELRIALHNIWQRRWLALGLAWLICILGWLAVAMFPNSYQSEARIFAQMQSLLPDKVGMSSNDRVRQIERVEQTLISATNLEKVIKSTDLGKDIASAGELQSAIQTLREEIKVVSQQDNLFEITATISSSGRTDADAARLSREVVQKMIDIFVEENLSGGRGETAETLRFLDQQLAERQKELEAAEQKRVQFETEHLGTLPGIGSISQRLAALRTELRQIDSEIVTARSSLAAVNSQLGGTPPTIALPGGGNQGGARAQLSRAESELSAAYSRGLTDEHPDVVVLKKQVASLRSQAAREGPGASAGYSTPNPAYSSLQSMKADRQAALSGLESRRSQLQADINQLSSTQLKEPGLAAEQEKLNRDYDVLKSQYDKLLRDREDVRLQGDVESETDSIQFRVIDPPTSPRTPAAPNRPLLLLGVLFVAIGGGIGGAFGIGQLRPSFTSAESLENAVDLPVLGAVSLVVTEAGQALAKKRRKLFYGSCAGLLVVFVMLMAVEFIQRGSVA